MSYLCIIFYCNLKWDFHTYNLAGTLRDIIYKFVELKDVLPIKTIRDTYFAFY